eukprot:1945726-Rhodomonas_salina.2
MDDHAQTQTLNSYQKSHRPHLLHHHPPTPQHRILGNLSLTLSIRKVHRTGHNVSLNGRQSHPQQHLTNGLRNRVLSGRRLQPQHQSQRSPILIRSRSLHP